MFRFAVAVTGVLLFASDNPATDQTTDAPTTTGQAVRSADTDAAGSATEKTPAAVPDVLLRFFGPEGIPDKHVAYCGEMLKRHTERPTLGESLGKGAKCEFRKLDETKNSAVYAVLVSKGQKSRDYYVFLTGENDVWKLSAVRAFTIPGMYTQLIRLLGLSSQRSEEEEWQYQNGLLVTKDDRQLKLHLKEQVEKLDRIATLMADGSEAEAQKLAKSLFFTSVENRDGVVDLMLGGMLDNSVGYLFVPSGKKPPAMEPSEFIYVERITDHWYIYRTT